MPSRFKKRQAFRERLIDNLWLVIPGGVIAIVAFLGFTRGGENQRLGLIESFAVETPGTPLPPRQADDSLPGTAIPQLGREHIPNTEQVTYNSTPPTSGSHYDTPARWGIYNEAPVDEHLVHNLEHGGIIISYNPEQIEEPTLDQLRQQTRQLSQINPRIILTPRANLEAPLVLTAWGYLEKLDSYDPAAVEAFYRAHIARGPECVSGKCPS